MVWNPKQETVNVKRMMIYSLIPFVSNYAMWRIQKFWVINLILLPLMIMIRSLDAIMNQNTSSESGLLVLISLIVLSLYFLISLLSVRYFAQKYNEKIENIGIAVESRGTVISRGNEENDSEICKDDKCVLNKDEVMQHTIRQHTNTKITIIGDSEESCPNCYHEKTLHVSINYQGQELVETECIGCKKDGLTVICKEFFETSSNNKQATSNNEKLEESKRHLEDAERKLEEKKKKKKEESRNKMERDEKLEESKRHLEDAERKLEEKKKKKEESRNSRDIEKQITMNEEKIRKIEEENKKLDEED